MLGVAPSPQAFTRHLLDYPLDDGGFELIQRPLSPPKRSSREPSRSSPILRYLGRTSSPAKPSTVQTLLSMLRRAQEPEAQPETNVPLLPSPPTPPPAKSTPEPITPAPVGRIPRQHAFSPVTPSRLSITSSDNRALSRADAARQSLSPYFPIHLIPRREQPEIMELIHRKEREFAVNKQPKQPVYVGTTPPDRCASI
jgi:hypothetical protein